MKVTGAGEAAAALEGIAASLLPLAARGMASGLEAMAQEAKRLAPVDSGELRDSIGAGPVTIDGDGVSGSVRATAGHATYVEMGARDQHPQPFLFPAYQAHRDALTGAVADAIKEGLG